MIRVRGQVLAFAIGICVQPVFPQGNSNDGVIENIVYLKTV